MYARSHTCIHMFFISIFEYVVDVDIDIDVDVDIDKI